jgi:pimeloyl-ACP methyl ester carboxylesterase
MMIPVGVLPFYYKMSGVTSMWICLGCNIFMVLVSIQLFRKMDVKAARKVMFSNNFPEEMLEKAILQMQDESFLAFLEMTALKLPDYRKVKTPMLIVGGEKDYLIPEKATRKMAELYQSDPFIVKNAPHNLMMEPGWEKVAEKIETFFLS